MNTSRMPVKKNYTLHLKHTKIKNLMRQDTVRLHQTKKAVKSRSECFQPAGHYIGTRVPYKQGSISLE